MIIVPEHICLKPAVIRHFLIVLSSFISLSAIAAEDNVENIISSFEKNKNQVEVANKFFKELKKNEFIDEDIVFSSKTPIDSVRQMTYYWTAEWYSDCQKYELAKQYGLKALPLYNGDSEAKADCLNLLGVVYVRLGDFASGIVYTKQCLDLDLKSGDNDRIASSYSTLTGTYIAAEDTDAAEKYVLQGLQYADKAENSLRKTILLGMASEIYSKKEQYEKAVKYADEAYVIDSLAGRQNRAAIRLSQKANALAGLKKYHEAEATFRKAIPILKKTGNYHSIGIDYNQIGFMLLKQNKNKEAASYFTEADKIFEKTGDLYNQVHSQRGLYESYWKIDPDKSHFALQKFNALKDSLYQQSSAEAVARYKVELEVDNLKNDIEQHNSDHRRDLLIIAALVTLLVIGNIVFHHIRAKRYKKEVLTLMDKIEDIKAYMSKDTASSDTSAREQIDDDSPEEISEFEKQVVQYVNEGLPKGEYSVTHLAAKFNMGEQTFRRRFVETTGKLPKAFITAIQMDRAATLLKENKEITIAEVAHECGFDELSAFSRSFKRFFGCSPSDYRADEES